MYVSIQTLFLFLSRHYFFFLFFLPQLRGFKFNSFSYQSNSCCI
jgi:hypothetical protein